jgi:hypothetical protein
MMLVQDKDDGYFFELKRLVKLNSGTFNKRDLYDLYSNMESYCIRKTRDADLSFLPEQADLYKEMLSLSIFPIEKDMYFPPELYKNIVRSSIRTGEPGWGLKFIEEYTSKLNPGMRNHYYYFCLALIQFTQKRFDQSLDALAHLVTHEQMDTEQIKSLQIRLYYETDQPDAALDQIDTYRHFILNNRKISAYTRENYEPFIVFTRELIKLKYGTQKREVERREMLRDKISKAVPLANKKWLLEKLDELT